MSRALAGFGAFMGAALGGVVGVSFGEEIAKTHTKKWKLPKRHRDASMHHEMRYGEIGGVAGATLGAIIGAAIGASNDCSTAQLKTGVSSPSRLP
jgi:outer membrane lipoprotein SlyB